MVKTREELHKQYNTQITKIWNKHHLQPSITLEYIYMAQTNKKEATQMLTLEVQRSLIYNNNLSYNNYSDTVEQTIQDILKELNKD